MKRESFNANPDLRRQNASSQLRDSRGHFIKAETTVKTPLDALKKDPSASNSSDDENIVDVKVRNPLSRITKLLENIKKNQNTKFGINFTIPLIALPVFLILFFQIFFQLGRFDSECGAVYTSKIGMFELITAYVPEEPNFWERIFSFIPKLPTTTPESELVAQTRALLIGSNEPITVSFARNISVGNYRGQSVILTGNYSSCTNTITLDAPENITINNSSVNSQ